MSPVISTATKYSLQTLNFKVLEISDHFEFDCGNDDLNDFFLNDAIPHKQYLIGVTYVFYHQNKAIAFFTVSNDSIELPNRLKRKNPRSKQYRFHPAVKIGRLGVHKDCQGTGIGSDLMDFIKGLFVMNNKTGCRFITVDAYNEPLITKYYLRNDFICMTAKDENESTRSMVYDLIPYRNAVDRILIEKGEPPSFSNR